MICYKKQKEAGTEPLSEQQFYRLLRSKRWNNNIDLFRQTGKSSYKESLPCICFQATFDVSSRAIRDKKTKKVIGHEEGRWNLQKYANLTGLVVLDIDKIENPEELINGKLKTEDGKLVAREEWVAQHHYPLSTIHYPFNTKNKSVVILFGKRKNENRADYRPARGQKAPA